MDDVNLCRYPRPETAAHGRGRKRLRKRAKLNPSAPSTELSQVYGDVEKRKFAVGEYGDYVDELHGLYSADALPCSVGLLPGNDEDGEDEAFDLDNANENNNDEEKGAPALCLPTDGSIFVNGLPFHHCVLTRLEEKQHKRLLKNGIEISRRRFSAAEDRQIFRNWREYAERNNLMEEEAAAFMGCQTKRENADDRKERLQLMQRTHFRPWMCKRMLNRTCVQVFRRCYHLFRDDREWSQEDDEQLLELHVKHEGAWEAISTELCRTRYACQKRYTFLSSGEARKEHEKRKNWTNAELVRLYLYISSSLDTHPVFVATDPDYAHYENSFQWDVEKMELPHKSIGQCQRKWEEIKTQLREAKERLATDIVAEVERAVFPNSRLLCGVMARQQVRMPISCDNLVKAIDALLALCAERNTPLVDRLSVVDMKEYNKRLSAIIAVPFEVSNPAERVLRRIGYILKICQFYRIFDILPIDHVSLNDKVRAIAHFMRRASSFQLTKRQLRKYVRHFVRDQGWRLRPRVVLVDKNAKGDATNQDRRPADDNEEEEEAEDKQMDTQQQNDQDPE